MSAPPPYDRTRRTLWGMSVFYLLIVCEFFYMASPFAVYFYSIYRPWLILLIGLPDAAWLSSFFLPHIVVETTSPWINAHNLVGGLLTALGILVFSISASQVYFYKISRRGPVMGGLYQYIRHPQYAALMLCSFGMLLLWPRFLVLLVFVTMVFAYSFLARAEERECEAKFGQAYLEYRNRVGMFLPVSLPFRLPFSLGAGIKRLLAIGALYGVSLGISFVIADGIKYAAINSLYSLYTPSAAFIAAAQMDPQKMETVAYLAQADPQVQARLAATGAEVRFINYVVPTTWQISEIPMRGEGGHRVPQDYDRNLYKVIFSQAVLPPGQTASGAQILFTAIHKTAILEVWVDLAAGQVTQVMEPPATVRYDGVPVPVY
jgi:protein-S-isoprenylcysteine O-methyltransferase Ste14